MTQRELILKWIDAYGHITPAKMAGRVYLGEMFGSEVDRRCRELRADGLVESFHMPKSRFVSFRRVNEAN